jgi:hypothetical protein
VVARARDFTPQAIISFWHSVISPLFSGFNSFADGIYSTLWGDSLCGGLSDCVRAPVELPAHDRRLLARIAPYLLVAIGAAVAIIDSLATRHRVVSVT